jgi:hypothetical protein
MLTVTIFILLLVFFEVSKAEGIATGIAGFVAPMLAEVVKRVTGASGFTAIVVTVVVSAAIAVVSLYMAGEIHSVGDVIKQAMAIFGVATVVYRGFMAAKDAAAAPTN